MHSSEGVTISGSEGFLFRLCSWCLWNGEVCSSPRMGSPQILCLQKSLLQSRNCAQQEVLESWWGRSWGGEEQMYAVCWSTQCSYFKIGPLSSAVMAMQINTSHCHSSFLAATTQELKILRWESTWEVTRSPLCLQEKLCPNWLQLLGDIFRSKRSGCLFRCLPKMPHTGP